jgi:hypothetical protein
MFEIGIFPLIFLAAAYWAVLWLMGRREDVLHGEFVEANRLPQSTGAASNRDQSRLGLREYRLAGAPVAPNYPCRNLE